METKFILNNDDCQSLTFIQNCYRKDVILVSLKDHPLDKSLIFEYEKERLLTELKELVIALEKHG